MQQPAPPPRLCAVPRALAAIAPSLTNLGKFLGRLPLFASSLSLLWFSDGDQTSKRRNLSSKLLTCKLPELAERNHLPALLSCHLCPFLFYLVFPSCRWRRANVRLDRSVIVNVLECLMSAVAFSRSCACSTHLPRPTTVTRPPNAMSDTNSLLDESISVTQQNYIDFTLIYKHIHTRAHTDGQTS